MKRLFSVLTLGVFFAGASVMLAQEKGVKGEAKEAKASAKASAKAAAKDVDATYGRIKELTPGKNVVIDVDNAPDKSFDLADKDLRVTMAKSLKVGDPVKVVEHEVMGKTKRVTITKHTGGGVAHGDKDPAAKKP